MASNDKRAPSVTTTTTTNHNRKLRSKVWEYFNYLPSSVPGVPDKAQCTTCGAELTAGKGASHLMRHIGSKTSELLVGSYQQIH